MRENVLFFTDNPENVMKPIGEKIQNYELLQQEKGEDLALPAAAVFACISLFMLLFGLTMLYSTSFGIKEAYYFNHQLVWAAIGMAGLVSAIVIGYRRFSNWSPVLMAGISVLLLIAFFCPEINGAHRWIKVPGIGSIQPSEYGKVILSLFLAKYISERARFLDAEPMKKVFLPAAAWSSVMIGLVFLGKDWGTTALLLGVLFITFFAAGMKVMRLLVPAGLLMSAGFLYIKYCDRMRWLRMTKFMDPESDASSSGYQLTNSLYALGSGDWFGLGFAESRMKMRYLPEAHTDFILSIVGEELGLAGMLVIVLLYLAFVFCAVRIAVNARTRQGMLLAFALGGFIGMQALINIGVITGGFPTKGMPAPFFSYGGSNLVSCMTASGLILSVAFDSAFPDYQEKWGEQIRAFFHRCKIKIFGEE